MVSFTHNVASMQSACVYIKQMSLVLFVVIQSYWVYYRLVIVSCRSTIGRCICLLARPHVVWCISGMSVCSYEVQLCEEVRRKGLGKFLMQILELMAFKYVHCFVTCICRDVDGISIH